MKKLLISTILAPLMLISVTANAFDQSSPANSLVVGTTGNVGVGTASPDSLMHLKKDAAAMKVEDTNAIAGNRQLLELVNSGGIGMRMNNTDNGSVWDFNNTNSGNFTASKVGTGGFEFEVQGNGRTKIKSLGTLIFDMQSSGNLKIPNGTVTATNYVTSSSRALKEDFSQVDNDNVMSKLEKLELTKWRYKDPEVKGHHIGPMAEEFYKLFGLGPDNKHVVATDMASIALIAAKSLKNENDLLKKQLQDQSERLSSIEKMLINSANLK